MLTGSRLGVYQVQERIGAGGMGEVYRARDTRITPDGTRIVFDRLQDNSDIVLIDLERRESVTATEP